jgi:hypothetical protein
MMDDKPEPKTIDLRARTRFQTQPDGTVIVKIPPVVVIEPDDHILLDIPFFE